MTKANKIPKKYQQIEERDATHWILCVHCCGNRVKSYKMKCVLLSELNQGKARIIVFGDRYWKDTNHKKRIRYVDTSLLFPIADIIY